MLNQKSVIINIPTSYPSGIREQIGNDVVNFMVDRTRRGLDRYNKPFRKYSSGYTKSTEFKAAGKSQNNPNLRLTGDMQSDIELLNHGVGFIKVGFPAGSEANEKATWTSRPERGGREMLGIMPKDLNTILSRYPQKESENTSLFTSFANEILRRVVG